MCTCKKKKNRCPVHFIIIYENITICKGRFRDENKGEEGTCAKGRPFFISTPPPLASTSPDYQVAIHSPSHVLMSINTMSPNG